MLRFVDHQKMGRGEYDWLDTYYHFSFANYFNPQNMHFGVLRVVNDDIVQAGKGFDMHPHENMEIISYVVDGELSHADNMNNQRTVTRGQVQYMSAGTGVWHSEYNHSSEPVRLLQIWIMPDQKNYPPNYGDYEFAWEERQDGWLAIASGDEEKSPIQIHADVNISVTEIAKGEERDFAVAEGRQAYLILIEGEAEIGEHKLAQRDALEIIGEDITIKATEKAHIIVLEMKQD